MTQAILKFNLPEDQEDFQMAVQGIDYYCVLSDILEELRKIVKYQSDEYSDEYLKAIEHVRSFIFEQLRDRGLDI